MKSIIKKSLLVVASCITAMNLFAAATFGFESESELSTNFTYTCEYSNATMTIADDLKHGGNYSLKAYMGGSGGKSNWLVTKASYSNITEIKFYLASSDKGKTKFALESCANADFSSGVNSILALTTFTDVPGVPSSPSNKTFYEITFSFSTPISGYLRFTFNQPSSSGKYMWLDDLSITYAEGPVISSDNTLKSLTYDGKSVPDFDPSKTSYDVELPAGTTTIPTVEAVANHEKATVEVMSPSSATLPCYVYVKVTAENEAVNYYKVNFTVESAFPKVESATWENISGTATVDNIGMTITGQVKNGSSLVIEPEFTGKNIETISPAGAQDFSAGSIEYTFTSISNDETKYLVTITEADPISSNADLSDITVHSSADVSVKYDLSPAFDPNVLNYTVDIPAGSPKPVVQAYPADNKSTVVFDPAATDVRVPGIVNITVTAEDKETVKVYTIAFETTVPHTDLELHQPGKYEALDGYCTPLVLTSREYEVYYCGKAKPEGYEGDDDIPVVYTKNNKGGFLISTLDQDGSKITAKDNWFSGGFDGIEGSVKAADKEVSPKADSMEEFADMPGDFQLKGSDKKITFHIKGYDQFSFVGKDGDAAGKSKQFIVKIDGNEQTFTVNKEPSLRRFDISTGEHVIEISSIGSSACKFYAFSLRVPQIIQTKRIKGNDTTQVLLQTTSIKPVYYFTKYNSTGRTELIWEGQEATGISLQEGGKGTIGDTLILSGKAMCPVGTYTYRVACFEGSSTVEMNSVKGTFSVKSYIEPVTDTIVEVFQDENMEPIQMRYYALDENVSIEWKDGNAPEGITTRAKDGQYTISGEPRTLGVFDFVVRVEGGNSVIGQIEVRMIDLEHEPILYLYKSQKAYTRDGIYQYLETKGKNLVARKAMAAGLRSAEQYKLYKWIFISDDADADNAEILAVTKGGANLPVLNMKSFSYSYDRLGWGEPNNGSLTDSARYITVQRDDHPIFKALGKKQGEKVQVLSSINKKGLMPIAIDQAGTVCLATAFTRSMDDYNADGEMETFIHEVPSSMRGGTKYICMPISINSSNNLTNEGKKLIDAVVEYLLNDEPTVSLPVLQITRFTIGEADGEIRETNDTIVIDVDLSLNPEIDPKAVVPTISVADKYTHVVPSSGDTVDLSLSAFSPVQYEVTDYINRRVYDVIAHFFTSDGIEEVYTLGEWITIYDIYGRKIATTNENLYTIELPHGMYVAVTETGQTIKITR